ncbi:MAG: prolipoprotein diacylglyceryl transferase [Clostridiaceae bacterium]
MYLHLLQPFASAMKLPSRVAFSVAGFDIYWSGLLLAVGIILAILLAQVESKRKKLPSDTAVDLCLIGIPMGVVFARIAYVLLHLSYYKASPLTMLYIWDGGLSVYGAIAGVLIGIVIYSLAKKLKFFSLTDLLAPGLLLAQGFALWGNFFDQVGYGPEVKSASLEWFPFSVLIEKTDTIHYAAFFYGFVWCALVFAALWLIVRKRAKREGALTLWYILLFSIGQFALEFLLQSTETVLGVIRISQLVYGVLAITALLLLVLRSGKEPVPKADETATVVETAKMAEPETEPQTETEPAAENPTKADEVPEPNNETPKEA